MPGDPAVVNGAERVPDILSAADLLMAIAVKLPPFWLDNIEPWLIQSESQFHLKGVVCSQTKFDYVVKAMSQSYAVKVLDFIRTPPADPYRHIKEHLLKMYALTDYARYEAISSLSLLGDVLPFTLMLKMLTLLPADHQACFFLRGAFIKGNSILHQGPPGA